ncbi:hypothetical protein ABZ942_32185 [Nocardia sp. NPDC046473]|uniref:hypothetical protein n=1 Tax=Nocardia sp. NPDC046473 TaxID=3155733 RepID=UPI0033E1C642
MSTLPPPTRGEGRGGPSGAKQALFLACGVIAGAVLAVAVPWVGESTGVVGRLIPSPWVVSIGLTVVFTDNVGTQRWLTPTAFQVPGKPNGIDDEVVVRFDPEDPGDIARIVVEVDNGVSRIVQTR